VSAPGASFAYAISEAGQATQLPLDGAELAAANAHFLWVHVNGSDPACLAWLRSEDAGIGRSAVDALTARETRPRAAALGHGAIVNLRGPDADPDPHDDTGLVSIRMWAERGRVVSLGYRPLAAMPDLRMAVEGRRVRDAGDFITTLALLLTDRLAPEIREVGDRLDVLEERVAQADQAFREELVEVRTEAIEYRRFIWPQKEAIGRLTGTDFVWLDEDDRLKMREVHDQIARIFEELESIRERAALVSDQLWDLRAEETNRRTLLLSIVAAIFLPLGYVAGLMGMNVPGIPFSHDPHGFWKITGLTVLTGTVLMLWFRRRGWL